MSSPESPIERLMNEIHRQSVWQILAVYLAGGWVGLQVVSLLREEQILPAWAFRAALLLFLVGLPVVLVTAFVQKRVDSTEPPPSRRIARVFTWRNAVWTGLLGFAAWGLVVTGWLLVGSEPAIPPSLVSEDESTRTVAIFPFSVSGSEDVDYLEEGMVDLLSTALDGAGEMRAVDPFALISVVRDATGGGPPTPLQASELATRLGADHYVAGSVIDAGRQIRLRANLYRADGEPLDDAEVVADESEILTAVDDLARRLLPTFLSGPATRLPQLAAQTTTSLEALKAYLEGERAFRSALWEQAIDPLQRAVALDSTFAMAWYRQAVAALWTFRDSLARASSARAMDLSRSLPDRDRRLVTATNAWVEGRGREAARLYRDVVASYPDDLEGWLHLGDVLWHHNPLHGFSAMESRAPLERVLELDPGNNEALIHLRHVAAWSGRWAEYDSLVSELRKRSPDHYEAPVTMAERAFVLGDSVERAEALSALRATDAPRLSLAALAVGMMTEDPARVRRIARLWLAPARARGERAGGHVLLAYLDVAEGRLDNAWHRLEMAADLDPLTALQHHAFIATLPFVDTPAEELRSLRSRLVSLDPSSASAAPGAVAFFWHQDLHVHLRHYLLGLVSVTMGEVDAAGRYADELAAMPAPKEAGSLTEDLAEEIRGRVARDREGPEAALRLLERSRMEVGWPRMHVSPFHARTSQRYLRGLLLSELGRDDEAVAWLDPERWNPYELSTMAPSHRIIGRILDERGDVDGAVEHYRRFAELWRNADPALRPQVHAVEARLNELSRRK